MVSALHRALFRDLWHLRGQVTAAALVTACGIAAFVTMLSAYRSIERARDAYYADYRFADAFAQLQRAPMALGAALARIPGVTEVDRRIVEDVSLHVPGLLEPATGRLISLPADPSTGLNRLFLREGRWPKPGPSDEIVASETFARADHLAPGSRIGAILNGRWKELRIVGLVLSPEYVYEVAPGMIFPDNRRFGVLWMDREALAGAFGMKGAFNDLALRTATAASLEEVARGLKLSPSDVYGFLTFYAQFRLTPPGETSVRVCQGTACHVRGGKKILEEVEKVLDVQAGGTTKDRKYSVERIACFGACSLAPVVVVGSDVYGRLTPQKVKKLLQSRGSRVESRNTED